MVPLKKLRDDWSVTSCALVAELLRQHRPIRETAAGLIPAINRRIASTDLLLPEVKDRTV
jgi:hypothetical protein